MVVPSESRHAKVIMSRDAEGELLKYQTQQQKPGYHLKGKAETNNTSFTSKWSRRMRTHLNKCTTVQLYNRSAKRQVEPGAVYISSSNECVLDLVLINTSRVVK